MANLYLVGPPGCGKGTVGRRLGERLGWPFVDTAEEIVNREGMEISALVEKGGELYFRDLEQALLLELSARNGWIVATGGGIVIRGRNVEIMRHSGVTVYLRVRPDALSGGLQFPMRQWVMGRKGMYEWADLTVDATDKSAKDVAEEIVRLLGSSNHAGIAIGK